ncbi:hypothetical protein F8388_011468 [Cannabis sativa]|uniref:Uncharacterized protein n=1 Tax=Cannabis sativa TaxID=3483 RepID=A0A7J6G400_CANSA|nr:hypothetical protein F8388_011468 [Cannabis sativa]
MDWWKCLVKGDPEIDTQKETEVYGTPKQEEMQKENLLKILMAEHPETKSHIKDSENVVLQSYSFDNKVGHLFSLIGFKNTLDFLRMRVFEVALDNMQAKVQSFRKEEIQSRIPTNLGGAEDDLDMYGGGIKTSATTIDWGQVI